MSVGNIMGISDDRIEDAVKHTEILRLPKQTLATFGNTNIAYYMVTEPVYSDMESGVTETVVRKGRVIAQRPRIVTPYYLSQVEGFSPDAKRYFRMLSREQGPDTPGIIYSYQNKPEGLTIIVDNLDSVVEKINADIDESGDPLVTIIKGRDELWDVSLMKFIFEITKSSFQNNLIQLKSHGMLDMDDGGVPLEARIRIEELFKKLNMGEIEPCELKEELGRWSLFDEYQDRFFSIFHKK
ncbi:MAG: hypothetical protein MUO92_05620 [Dehalococcoidales bacterium]|nr:hypothetical protein [Dehalococcoidales bacterium]